MSGEWIRMRVGLDSHPKVIAVSELLIEDEHFMGWAGLAFAYGPIGDGDPALRDADRYAALRVTRYVCVAAMLRFWGYANEHARGDSIAYLTSRYVDEIAGVPGLGAALAAVGWLTADPDGGVVLPDFSQHNTSAEKRKSGSAERQKAYRERKKLRDAMAASGGCVTRDVTSHAREEKRREDIPPSPRKRVNAVTQAVPVSDLLVAGFSEQTAAEFIAHKAARKAPLTRRAWQLHLGEAEKAGWTPLRAAEHVMAKGWKGFEASYVAETRNGVPSRAANEAPWTNAR